MSDHADLRDQRLAAYAALRRDRPQLFENPAGAAFEIIFDRALQDAVANTAAEQMVQSGLPAHYGDIGVVYQDKYTMLVRDAVRFRSGKLGVYIREMSPNEGVGSAVLAITPAGKIVLIRHFRHATRRWHWELPRGFGEPGSDGAETARREVLEELGVKAREVTYLGSMDGDTGAEVSRDEIYLARIDAPTWRGDGAEEEGIDDVISVSPDEFAGMMRDGTLSDTFALVAYAYAVARGLLPNRN
jgi:ADP-ribose diphosphatase